MGCGQSSKASQPAEQQHQPAIGSTPGGSSSSSTPAAVVAGGRLVVNSTATLVAAQAAGLALEGAKSAVPFAGALINGIERVHTVFKAHEDVQREIQHLAFRLEFIMATGDYNSLSDHERTLLDKVLKEVEDAVGRGYSRSLEKIFKPEDVRDDLVRAGRFLTDGLIHIGLYRSRTEELKSYEAQMQRSHFELSRDKVVVDEYLTESRCKVYLGTLTLENGQIARVAIKLCRPKGASTVEQLREELLKGECKLQYKASHRSILRLLGLVMHHPHPQCQGSTAAAATPSALLAAGADFSLLLLQKSKELISFGDNRNGECDLPKELRAASWTSGASRQRLKPSVEVLQVATGYGHTLYLVQEEKGRTAVHAAGWNKYKQCEVPQALGRGPKVKAVAAGNFHSVALTVAGKVLFWGDNNHGQTDVQAFERVQLVAAGREFSAVVTEDRKLHVVGWCDNKELKRGVQLSGTPIAMAAGEWHIVVLSSDGRAQGFRTSTGFDDHGQEIVPSSSIGERRIEAIACGGDHTVYLLQGGGVVAAGGNQFQQCDCRLRSRAIAVTAGAYHTLVRLQDGTLQTFGYNAKGQCAVPKF